jgi:hypothetical protein
MTEALDNARLLNSIGQIDWLFIALVIFALWLVVLILAGIREYYNGK